MNYPTPDPIWNEDPKAALAEIESRIAETGVFYAGSGIFKGLAELPANLAQIKGTQINLQTTEISDISALSDVPRITHLTLGKRISDIAVVAKLSDLEEFDAGSAHLTDISPLASGTRLKSIVSLDVSEISDLSCLDGMDLEVFDIYNYSGQRLPRFRSLERLSVNFRGRAWLSVFRAQDAGGQLDLSPLRDTKCLTQVSLESAVFNLPKGLEDLKSLDIALRDDRELGIFASYPKLERLTLRGTTITEFGPLVRCKTLRSLSIKNAKITDISAIKELPRLQDLNISGNPVTDIAPLSYIKGLRDIDASSTAITSLEGWNPQASLSRFDLNKTKVSDLSPLHGTSVFELSVADTPLASLEGISNIKGLQRLNVIGTHVETVPVSEHNAEVFHEDKEHDPRDRGWFLFHGTPLAANGFKLLPAIVPVQRQRHDLGEANPAPGARSLLAKLWDAVFKR